MDRYLVISADSHAGAPWDDYRSYLSKEHHEKLDEWIAEKRKSHPLSERRIGGQLVVGTDYLERFTAEEAVKAGGVSGAWDPKRRLQEMDSQGIAAEVIFPDTQNRNQPPFEALESPGEYDPRLQLAGAQAYNRWLADFCAKEPDRLAGIAVIAVDDIDVAVKEIRWAKDAGLRGGVLVPIIFDPTKQPYYTDGRYEPIWATCAELDMPIHSHSGPGVPEFHDLPGSPFVYLFERPVSANRLFSYLLMSAVFERHPGIKVVFADQGCHWIVEKLNFLDRRNDSRMFAEMGPKMSFKPSDYWSRNCWVTAPAMARDECDLRYAIGVHKMMWGTNYPEVEGTWPHTEDRVKATFAGVSPAEAGPILGKTAARIYHFDLEKLAPIAERVGPKVDEI